MHNFRTLQQPLLIDGRSTLILFYFTNFITKRTTISRDGVCLKKCNRKENYFKKGMLEKKMVLKSGYLIFSGNNFSGTKDIWHNGQYPRLFKHFKRYFLVT